MALSESALSELLVALTDRDRGVDPVRELAEWLARHLIELEAFSAIGAARYARTAECVTERNGHRRRTLTVVGVVTTVIPEGGRGWSAPGIARSG